MITYTVKYKLSGQWFFRQVRKVKGDIVLDKHTIGANGPAPRETATMRLIKENETVLDIPMSGTIFIYGKQRERAIEKRIREESNGVAQVNPG